VQQQRNCGCVCCRSASFDACEGVWQRACRSAKCCGNVPLMQSFVWRCGCSQTNHPAAPTINGHLQQLCRQSNQQPHVLVAWLSLYL
jgi:hypothetical protein